MIIEDKVVVELKSIASIATVHSKQVLTYLKLSGCKPGILISFNESFIKDGLTRIVNNL